MAGSVPLPQGIAQRKLPLSPRQCEVLEHIALGLTNAEIARQLSLGDETVRTHVANILQKLGAKSRAHAVAIGLSRELIPNPCR